MVQFMTSIKRAVLVAVTLTCGSAVPTLWADARPNPYLTIADRNPFGIKPAPPATIADPPPPPAAPLAKVVLTGVTSMFGPPRALLEITDIEPGKGQVVSKRILREGERDGSIEVLSIDINTPSVRIKNGPVETNVVFEVAKSGPTTPTGLMPPPISSPYAPPPAFTPPVPSNPFTPPGATPPGALNNSGRSGSGVSFYGASTPAATPPAPGVVTPSTSPNWPQNLPTAPPMPTVNTYGNTGDKQVPLRTMRTDLLDAARARVLQQNQQNQQPK